MTDFSIWCPFNFYTCSIESRHVPISKHAVQRQHKAGMPARKLAICSLPPGCISFLIAVYFAQAFGDWTKLHLLIYSSLMSFNSHYMYQIDSLSLGMSCVTQVGSWHEVTNTVHRNFISRKISGQHPSGIYSAFHTFHWQNNLITP